jgi:hypothetical protein
VTLTIILSFPPSFLKALLDLTCLKVTFELTGKNAEEVSFDLSAYVLFLRCGDVDSLVSISIAYPMMLSQLLLLSRPFTYTRAADPKNSQFARAHC